MTDLLTAAPLAMTQHDGRLISKRVLSKSCFFGFLRLVTMRRTGALNTNLMRLFLTMTALILLGLSASAQKVKVKGDVAEVDGMAVCLVKDDPSVRGSFYLNALDDTQLLYFRWVVDGDLNYYEVYDANDLDTILFEELATTGFRKNMVKKLYQAKVISAEGYSREKCSQHASKVGKEFTRKREERARRN